MFTRGFLAVTIAAILAGLASAAPPAPADRRLEKPVTVSAMGTDLGRLASLLTKQTGVRIRVAKDISDEKLNVFVSDYPLGRLQRNLATLFGYTWSVQATREGSPAYLFWRNAKTRRWQEQLRQQVADPPALSQVLAVPSDARLKKPFRALLESEIHRGPAYVGWAETVSGGLKRIAEASGIPMLSDHYTDRTNCMTLTGPTCADAFDQMNRKDTWAWSDGALLFRRPGWPRLMLAEIPLRSLEAIMAAGPPPLEWPDTQWLSFPQSLIAATLTDEQISNIRTYGYLAHFAYGRQATALMRFLATLSPRQLRQVWTERGLDPATLGPASREAFSTFYDVRWTANGYEPEVKSLRFAVVPPAQRKMKELLEVVVQMPIVLPKEQKISEMTLYFSPDPGQTAVGR